MAEQNGKNAVPQIPEGDLYLLVRINPKTQDFQCVCSDMISGLALHKMGGEYLENILRGMFAAPQIQAAPPAGFDPGMLRHFSKGRS